MRAISFFNNKGGVGKTTLTCNLAALLAETGCRVLLIDCDPQCNATVLVLGEERAASLYWPTTGSGTSELPTILDVVGPIEHGDADINSNVLPSPAEHNRFGVDVLPGHPRLSVVEDRLSDAWRDAISGDTGGLRKTSWVSKLVTSMGSKYDYVFLDLGPSLGSLNRTALLGSEYFCTPMGADIFSILGLRNISEWIRSWSDLYKNAIALCQQRHPATIERYQIPTDVALTHGYLGYTIQSYVAKYAAGERRPTKAYEAIIQQFPTEVMKYLGDNLAPGVTEKTVHLGDIPNMFSIVPLAQSAAAPVSALRAADGVRGAHHAQVRRYVEILKVVAETLQKNAAGERV